MRKLILIALMGALFGCGMVTRIWVDTAEVRRIAITSDAHANDTSATLLDIVFVMDPDATKQLPDNAVDWFDRKKALMLKAGKDLRVRELQIPPDHHVSRVDLPNGHKNARRVFVYANYLSRKGQMPLDITDHKKVELVLHKDTIAVIDPTAH